MGKIVLTAFVTLDGVIQAPGLPDEDRDGGFAHGGWTGAYGDPLVDERTARSVLDADALLIGRRTYELFSSFWPGADPGDPRTVKLNTQPKYVVSGTLRSPGWANTSVLDGDVAEEAAALKERHEHISVWGSSQVVAALLPAGLIDELVLMTFPLTVGGGKRLFPAGVPLSLTLAESATAGSGVVISTYRLS